jgi:hypothetical protein
MTVPFVPYAQQSAAGSFAITADGVICGTAYPDPETRFALSGGILDSSETLPMWGGMAIQELIPSNAANAPQSVLGGHIKRATTVATTTGFSVYDQNYAAVTSPASPAPQASTWGLINFFRLGSGQRVALECDPALISLYNNPITQQVSWDFTLQRIIAFATNAMPVKVLHIIPGNCMAALYNSSTGALTWNYNAAAAICVL